MSKEIIRIEGNINKQNMLAYQLYKCHNELKGLSEKTITGYEHDLFQWFRFLNLYQEDKTYKEVVSEDIEEYLMFCKTKGMRLVGYNVEQHL